ncbi:capsular biosynthesis protein [Cupriavidus necator]|uniref:capsular biosynthesis protein n=1 Tax=Cupriavidus necator TaxID=106590 RepID=UPI0030F3B160
MNFNRGDALFFPGRRAIGFRALMSQWPQFLAELLESEQIDAIVLFGQWRPHHRIAIELATQRGLPFYVFEEGYVRPWWITLETGEVKAGSHLRKLDLRALAEQPRPCRPQPVRFAFARMAWWSALYYLSGRLQKAGYPHYVHHRPFLWREAACWMRAAFRKCLYQVTARGLRERLLDAGGPGFFFLPLQFSTDSQLLHASRWTSNVEFIGHVVRSFSEHARDSDMLVIKHHPMERGHTDYAADIDVIARQHGVRHRIAYLHDGHVPSFLKRSLGVVVINSTVGIQALFHGVPVCVCGEAFYDKPGLTAAGHLDAFWKEPAAPCRDTFMKFYRYMLRTTQINASFYAGSVSGARHFPI